jgi:hypothetical protein
VAQALETFATTLHPPTPPHPATPEDPDTWFTPYTPVSPVHPYAANENEETVVELPE